MTVHDSGWDGPMTGTMRGRPLVQRVVHGGWWTVDKPCPACRLAVDLKKAQEALVAMRGEQERRCQECRQKGAHVPR